MRMTDWIFRGYADAREREIYKRSPQPDPPELPDNMLPEEWRLYFDGFYSGVQDNVRNNGRS